MLIVSIILGAIVCLNVIGFLVNTIFCKDELKAIQPYGKLVEVNGRRMHVYAMGSGDKIIVLLPGMGVPLPSADFGPLMRKLNDKYTVVSLEYFGVGFSDQTDTTRSNKNYTDEIRTALKAAGYEPPYILMPHSASGVYSEYYASEYPEEISSIIMLDTTSTAEVRDMPGIIKYVYSIAKLQQATGFTRLVSGLVPDTKLVKNGYTVKEIADYKRFSYHTINNTMINQSLLLMENIKEVYRMPFPEDIPVLKIISQQSIDAMAKKFKDDGMGYQKAHLNRLGENADYKVFDAAHFLYQTKADEIAKAVDDFIK